MSSIQEWIKSFHQDGFLVVPEVLSSDLCATLRQDLDTAYVNASKKGKRRGLIKRMFEQSSANLELFWQEPIVSFAEQLIADNGSDEVLPGEDLQAYTKGIPSANEVHVFHNNSFIIGAGKMV